MTLLPIVIRELRVAARRKSTYSARFKTAFAAALGGAVLLFVLNQFPLIPSTGLSVFYGLGYVGFFYCFALAGNTADCISEEKREGTLGLLFLTDLNGWDVALGKLCANSIKSLYAVISTFPVLAIVLTLGGVSAGQYCTLGLALLNLFFFAHAAGLLASVLSRVRARAFAFTGVLMYGFAAGPPLLAMALGHGSPIYPAGLLLAALSPGYAVAQAILPIGARFYWISLLMVHLLGWLLLALASWRLPFCWQEKAGPVRLRWRDRFRQWTYGPPAFRARLRRELAGINPFLWLVSRDRISPAIFKAILGLLGCFWIWVWFETNDPDPAGFFIFVVVINHLALIGGAAAEASRHLDEHRRTGALEFVLCSTPLPPDEIIAGQWQALRRLFQRPVILVLAADLLMVFLNHTRYAIGPLNDRLEFDAFVVVAMIMLVVDLFAAGWIGMWRAMANRRAKQNAAVVETVFFLLILPSMLLGVISGVISVLAEFSPGLERWLDSMDEDVTFGLLLGLWFVLGFAIAAGLTFLARKQLLTRFREMAVVQIGEPLGLLGRLGRLLGRVLRRRQGPGALSR
jgi:hypothetical protein